MRRLTSLLLLLLMGCHSYVDTGLPAIERGDRVRIHLAEPASFEVGHITANNVIQVDAEVVGWDEEERLALSAWWLTATTGFEFAGEGRTIYVPSSQINGVERRHVNVLNTTLFVIGVVGLSALIGSAAVGSGSGGDGPGPDPQ